MRPKPRPMPAARSGVTVPNYPFPEGNSTASAALSSDRDSAHNPLPLNPGRSVQSEPERLALLHFKPNCPIY
jgi:hypothetical protein